MICKEANNRVPGAPYMRRLHRACVGIRAKREPLLSFHPNQLQKERASIPHIAKNAMYGAPGSLADQDLLNTHQFILHGPLQLSTRRVDIPPTRPADVRRQATIDHHLLKDSNRIRIGL